MLLTMRKERKKERRRNTIEKNWKKYQEELKKKK